MKNITIAGKDYIEFNLNIPVLLNTSNFKSLEESFERYKTAYKNDGDTYDGTLDDFVNLCAVSGININIVKYAKIISR